MSEQATPSARDAAAAWQRGVARRTLLAHAAALPLAACARARDRAGIGFWAMDVEGENAKYLLPGFTAATGERAELQWLAWTAAHEKLLTAYAGGALPDVFMAARAWIAELALIGAIAPVPAREAALLDGVFAPDDLAIGSRALAVPWTLDVTVQFFRRDLLARAGYAAPPRRLDAWKAMLRAVKRVQGADRFAVLMQLNWPDHLFHLAAQQPDPLLRDRQSRGNFASPGFKAALAFYKSLFDERLAPLVSSTEASDPAGEIERGFVGLYPSGSWTRAELLRRRARFAPDRWAVAPMPSADGGPARAIVAGAVLCVARGARDPARAWSLVRYLTRADTELRLTRIAGALPARDAAWAAPALARDPVLATFGAALANPEPSRNLPEWERIGGEVQAIAERMVRGQLGVAQAATAMDARADAILAKRRWLLDTGRLA